MRGTGTRRASSWTGLDHGIWRALTFAVVLSLALVGVTAVRSAEAAPIPTAATGTTLEPGAYIIDMGVNPQTYENALQAYGLVYALMIEHLIPVEWIIDPDKTTDGSQASTDVDLEYDGREFTSGPFVIRAEYAAEAKAVLDQWGGPDGTVLDGGGYFNAGDDGVVIVGPTTTAITAPVYTTLTNWPNAVLDNQNGSIGQAYYEAAFIPETTISAATGDEKIAYIFKDPVDLTTCDDLFVLPHADPSWEDHGSLVPWNAEGGYIWAGCHAVSVLENVSDPDDVDPDPELNFLTTEGLIDFGDHDDGTPPYTYTANGSDPIMQFVGSIDDAQTNGSEQIYLPSGDSSWNPGAKVLAWDPDHPDLDVSPGEAATLVYGRAYDDPSNGLVMYESGHDLDTGDEAAVAAIRAFLNFNLLSGIERGLEVSVDAPATIVAEETVTVSATITGGSPGYEYEWVSTCGGTFDPVEGTTDDGVVSAQFTAPPGAQDCQVKISVSDLCGRGGFDTTPTVVVERADLSLTKDDGLVSITPGGELTYTLTVTNNGPNDATDVTVVDDWPSAQLIYVRSTPSQGTCGYGGSQVECDLGDLAVDESATIEITGRVRADATGVIENTATVDAPQLDLVPGNNTDTDETVVSGLRLEKSADPTQIDVIGNGGDPVDVTFTFVVSNVGPGELSNVTITDPDVPECEPVYQSGDTNGDGILQVGEEWIFTCVAPVGEDLVNTATASAETEEGDPVTAEDSAEVDAIAPGITVDKSPDGQTVTDGGDVVFDITVTNTGDVDLEDVTVTDPEAPSCDRTLGALAVGESITYSCALSPAPAAPSSGVNTIEVTGTLPDGSGNVTDDDDASFDVVAGDLEITKVPVDCATDEPLDGPTYYPGDEVCYLITVTNTGDTTQTDVVLTDDLPTGVDHVETIVTAPVTLIDDGFDRDVNDDNTYDAGWTEYNDNDQAKDGDVRIESSADCPGGDGQCLRITDGDKGLQWQTDLSGVSSVDVSYEYTITRNNEAGRFFVGCWDGGGWQQLDAIDYADDSVLATPDGPFSVDLTGVAIPPACQISGGALGIVADVEVTTAPQVNTNNEVLFDEIVISAGAGGISDDFENYKSKAYFSTGLAPGWGEYRDNDPADRTAGDVASESQTTPGDDCSVTGDCAVKINKKDKGLVWPADYSSYGQCTVAFDYRITQIRDGDGVISIGGDNDDDAWIQADSILMDAVGDWTSFSTTISAADTPGLFGPTSRIGVATGADNDDNDHFSVDNLAIACMDTFTTTSHPTIVDEADGIDLAPGDDLTAKVTGTVNADGSPFPRELVNVAEVTSDQEPDPGQATAEIERVMPEIGLDKSVAPEFTEPGSDVTYTFEVTNEGNDPLENVEISDPDVPECVPTLDSGDANGDGVLDLDETWIYTCTVTVDETFTNTATATGDPVTPGSGEDEAVTDEDEATVEVIDSGIAIEKTADPLIVRPGGAVTYTYEVTLAEGTVESLNAVSVTDDRCAPVEGPTAGDTNGDSVLDDGETWIFTCTTTLDETTTNIAEASGTDRLGNLVTDDAEATVDVIDPAIAVDKTADPTVVSPGDEVTYSFEVTNPGNDPLSDVTIIDNKCSPLVPASGEPNPGDTNGDGLLDPGETWTYTCTTVVEDDVTNEVVVGGRDSLGRPWLDWDIAVVDVIAPSLDVSKTADQELVFPGESVTYTIVVFNDGDADFTTVDVVDDTCSPLVGPSGDGGELGVLEPGEAWEYTCTTTLDETTTNTVTVDATGPDGNAEGTDSDRVRVHDPLLDITKEASELLVDAGTPVTYTYTITNVSVCDEGDVVCELDNEIIDPVVTDDMCSPVDYVSGDIEGDGRLSIGETWTYECTAVITETTTNVASVTGSDPDGNLIPREPPTAEVTVEVTVPDLSLVKDVPVLTDDADGSGDISEGDTLTYTITATNTGNATLTDVVVIDTMLVPGSATCPVLEPGETCVLEGTYLVTAEDVAAGEIENSATGDSGETETVTTPPVVTPLPTPRLTVDKEPPVLTEDADGSGDISVGDTLTYTVTATNTGTANLTDVTVTDPLLTPSEVTCPTLAPGEECVLEGTYVVTEAAGLLGFILNSAVADSDQTGSTRDVIVTPLPRPALELAKDEPVLTEDADGSGDISEGDTLTYTVTATNTGTANLTDVTVSDPLLTPDSITCPLLAPGETCVLEGTYVVMADDVAAGSITNTAEGGGDQTGTITTPPVVTPVPRPELEVVKTGPVNADEDGSGDVSVGDTLTYTVTATNTGTANLTNATVTDPLLTPDSITCPTLAPGEECVLEGTYVVTADDVAAGEIRNTGVGGSDQTDEIESIVVTPVPTPRLDVEKTAPTLVVDADGSGDISVGDTLSYTVTATNTGSANLTNVVVTDSSLTPDSITCPTLAPGDECVLEGSYVVTEAAVALGFLINLGTADSDQTGSTRDLIVTPLPRPELEVVKTEPVNADEDGSGDVSVGDTLTYTVTATNTGTANLTNVTVTDSLLTPDSITCPTLAPGEECVLEGTYVVTADDVAAGEIRNTGVGDSDQTDEIESIVVTPVPIPGMSVVKSDPVNADEDGSGDISEGDTLTYTVTATNTGTSTLTDVVVSDPLLTPDTITCPLLAPGETCALEGTYVVTADDVAAGEIENTATGDSDQTDEIESIVVTPVPTPRLIVVKDVPELTDDADGSGDISEGDTLTYTVTATNTGTANLTNVTVSDPLLTPDSITCPTLAPGEECVLEGTYVVTAADVASGSITNTAEGGGDQTETITTPPIVTPVGTPDMEVVKTGPTNADEDGSGDVSEGDTLTYTVTVTNTGGSNLTNVVVSDPMLTPASITCDPVVPGGTCVLEGTYVVTADDVAAGSITNTGSGDSDQTDQIDSIVVTPVPLPDLAVQKDAPALTEDADGSGDISVGDTLTYTVTATNTGTANLTNVTVTDPLLTPSEITCPTLAPGETCVLEGSYVVTQTAVDLGFVLNSGVADSDQTGSTRDIVVTPVPRPRLEIVKDEPVLSADADGSGDISVGDTLTYTVTATNTGTANLTNVTVTDPLLTPSEITCPTLAPGETCVLEGSYVVTGDDVMAGSITNTGAGGGDQTETITTPPVVTPLPSPQLEVVKSDPVNADEDGSGDISVGDTLTYTVTATNTGEANLTNVVVSDPLLTPDSITCPTLAPGETCVLEGTYVVTAADVAAGEIDNTAFGGSDQTDEIESIVVTPVPYPELSIVKDPPANADEDGSGDISEGDTLTYTVTVTNTGTATVTNVVVSDPLLTPDSITCPTLAPGEQCVLEGTYVVTADDVAAGEIRNTGTGDGDQVGVITTPPVVTPVPEPGLEVVKTGPVNTDEDGSGDVSEGDTLTYTVTATNTGEANLTNVVVSDPLLTPDSITCPTLAPGETCVLEGTYVVTADDVAAGEIRNTGTGGSDQTDEVESIVVTPVPAPRLEVVKTGPVNADEDGSGDISVGDTLTYTVTATNTGTASLTDVVVSDPMLTPGSVTCALVAPGETCVLQGTYTVTADDVATGEIDNTATGGSDQTDEIESIVVTPLPFPDLALVKDVPVLTVDADGSGDISEGDTLTYTVTATNTGTANLTDVVVIDTMLTPGSETCPLVAPGETCVLEGTYTVTAEDVAAGEIENTATGSTDQTETITTPPVVTPVPSPELEVVKTGPVNADEDGSGDVSEGDTLTYTVTATNTGTANLTDVVVIDAMLTPGSQTCPLLAPGETCVLEGTYTVTAEDVAAGEIENTATGSTDQTETITTPPVVTPVPSPELEVVKSDPVNADEDGSGDLSVGDTLTYTVTATNTGEANLTNVVVSDPLLSPDSVTCPLLAPGETCVLEGTYVVTADDVETGTIENTGTGGSDQTDEIESIVVTPLPVPDLMIVKDEPVLTDDADGSEDISEGDTLTYTVTATNNGTANLTDVVVSDPLLTPDSVTCPLLAPGETCVLEGTYVVTADDVETGSITNTGSGGSDQTETITTPPVVTPLVPPDLTVVKTGPVNADEDGSGDVSVGDTLTYTVTATNTGEANLTNVVVSDSMLDPDSITCEFMEPGDTCVLEGTYVVTAEDVSAGEITNTGTGDGDQTGGVDSIVVSPVPLPRLMVEKGAPLLLEDADESGDISAGDTLSYTVTATNTGTANLTDVVVSDPLLDPDSVTCPLLAPGETCELTGTYIVTAGDVEAGSVANTGTGGSDQTEVTTTPPVVTPLPAPELAIVKDEPVNADDDGSGDIEAGDTLTYTVTATNTGEANLTNVVVSDPMLSPDSVTCAFLAPGETCVLEGSYVVTDADAEAGSILNTATADSDQTGSVTDQVEVPVASGDELGTGGGGGTGGQELGNTGADAAGLLRMALMLLLAGSLMLLTLGRMRRSSVMLRG
ncbi:DUF7507 domain-containing protein [Demequina zhanjiangensis]|uniref:Uncharacterized protein n=1 Tax=Demequina zhanjiangensis TaxID=3051659 RepID=A0ABT8FYQ7_9MICO|nr:hypothetical protein [Demequina sp. SYSU T00b26]MDN4471957.1 hypothetical protein [Demequina sp. SYSU T00b26]